jgi:hypothetical protein
MKILGPFCCLNTASNKDCLLNQPCGTLASFPRNDPRIDGFLAGTSVDGSEVYVGTGSFKNCPSPNVRLRSIFSSFYSLSFKLDACKNSRTKRKW